MWAMNVHVLKDCVLVQCPRCEGWATHGVAPGPRVCHNHECRRQYVIPELKMKPVRRHGPHLIPPPEGQTGMRLKACCLRLYDTYRPRAAAQRKAARLAAQE
jgi:hypothetical protein